MWNVDENVDVHKIAQVEEGHYSHTDSSSGNEESLQKNS